MLWLQSSLFRLNHLQHFSFGKWSKQKKWFRLSCLRPPTVASRLLTAGLELIMAAVLWRGGVTQSSQTSSFLTNLNDVMAPVAVALPRMCVWGSDVCRDRCVPAVLFQNKWGGIQCYFNQIASNLFPGISSRCVRYPLVSLADAQQVLYRPWLVS